MTYTGKPRV
jgi:hypothetical protein